MPQPDPIHIVQCHACGEVGDVVVDGVAPPPGDTLWEQSRWIAHDETLRNFVVNEPRGGVHKHVNLLVPPKHPEADAGFIIMEPVDTPPMSGSNSMCVATVLLETGRVPMHEGTNTLVLEAPGGLARVTVNCRAGRVESVTVTNHPSFAGHLDAVIEVEGVGSINVDTAYGGDSFAVVDAPALGFGLTPDEAKDLADLGVKISDAATAQLGFRHPTNPDWRHISFCLFRSPVVAGETRHAVAIRPGKIDRSPTGTGVSAHLALMQARGEADIGTTLTARSIIDSEFTGCIEELTQVGNVPAIVPSLTGRAWIYGRSELILAPDDPWPQGYRVADTWPGA